MKHILFILSILLAATVLVAADKPAVESGDSSATAIEKSDDVQSADQIVVYYLHLNRRCMTCGKLETYSREAIESGFADRLADSSMVFRVENFETEGNEHFAKDYQLYSQSLILSRQRDGEEIGWRNLTKIWELVGDKDAFIRYVQSEVTDFADSQEKK